MSDWQINLGQLFLGSNLLDLLTLFCLIFTRFLCLSLTMPLFGAQILPGTVRVGFSAALSIIIFLPLASQASTISNVKLYLIIMLLLKEALLGFLIGFLASLVYFAYELLGEFIDLARAANISKLLVPEVKHHASAVGSLFFQLALAMTFVLGYHRQIISGVYKSFVIFPPSQTNTDFLSIDFLSDTIGILHALFKIALELSFPVIVISFLIDLAFGLMNRIAPQINAYFLSLPAKMVGGLFILFLVLPFLLDDFSTHFESFMELLNKFLKR